MPVDSAQGGPPAQGKRLKGAERKQAISERALQALDEWNSTSATFSTTSR
jgi:hypothetical protein